MAQLMRMRRLPSIVHKECAGLLLISLNALMPTKTIQIIRIRIRIRMHLLARTNLFHT